jgi:hypothetical protein
MDVTQLLDPFVLAPYLEVVVAARQKTPAGAYEMSLWAVICVNI